MTLDELLQLATVAVLVSLAGAAVFILPDWIRERRRRHGD